MTSNENGTHSLKSDASRSTRVPLQHNVVAVLKEWMIENRDNPYPSDDVKGYLMLQTGVLLPKLDNWLSNARKRHWLPMHRKTREPRNDFEKALACPFQENNSNATPAAVPIPVAPAPPATPAPTLDDLLFVDDFLFDTDLDSSPLSSLVPADLESHKKPRYANAFEEFIQEDVFWM